VKASGVYRVQPVGDLRRCCTILAGPLRYLGMGRVFLLFSFRPTDKSRHVYFIRAPFIFILPSLFCNQIYRAGFSRAILWATAMKIVDVRGCVNVDGREAHPPWFKFISCRELLFR